MDDYVKKIKLVFEPDKLNVAQVDKMLEDMGKAIKLSEDDKQSLQKAKLVKNELEEFKNLLSEYEGIETESAKAIRKDLESKIQEYEKMLGLNKEEGGLKAELKETGKEFGQQVFQKYGQKFLTELGEIFTGAWEELENMLSYSRLSNAKTRDLAFSYGFSASEAYGYESAMSALGFQSEEDLYYATEKELTLFKDAFQKYSDKYTKLYDSGTFDTMLEYQVEMAEFEQDLKLEVADFFMQNKDAIKAAMNGIMAIAEGVTKVVSFLLGTDRAASRSAAISDTISNYTNKSVTNVSIDNTFNGIDASQRQNLTRLGALTTEQLKAALK